MTLSWLDLSYFAGLGTIILRYGTWLGLAAGTLVVASYFPPMRKPALALLITLGVAVVAYTVGLNDGTRRTDARWQAQQERIDKHADEAVSRGVADAATDSLRDPFDREEY